MAVNGCDVQVLSMVLTLFMSHLIHTVYANMGNLSLGAVISNFDQRFLISTMGFVAGTIINVMIVNPMFSKDGPLGTIYKSGDEEKTEFGCTQENAVKDCAQLAVLMIIQALVMKVLFQRENPVEALNQQLLRNVLLSVGGLLFFNVLVRPLINHMLADDTKLRDHIMGVLKAVITLGFGDWVPDGTLRPDFLVRAGATASGNFLAAGLSSTPQLAGEEGLNLSDNMFKI